MGKTSHILEPFRAARGEPRAGLRGRHPPGGTATLGCRSRRRARRGIHDDVAPPDRLNEGPPRHWILFPIESAGFFDTDASALGGDERG